MSARLTDDNGAIDFIDDNGVQCFVDDLGNFTCDETTAVVQPRGHKGGKHQIVISDGWHFVR